MSTASEDFASRKYDDLPPSMDSISPQDAARALASRRWNKDETPVSDGDSFLTGAASVDASQGYTEMTPLAHDVKEAAAAELEPDAAAQEIAEKRDAFQRYRESTTHDVERNYFTNNDPSKPTPANQVVSAEQASSDLTRARQAEAEALAQAENDALAQEIDWLRGYDPTQAQQQTQPQGGGSNPSPSTTPQPDQTAQSSTDDPVARALQDPAVLNAVNETINQSNQRAIAAERYYADVARQNAVMASAALVASFPELQGLTPEQLNGAIQAVIAANPERGRAMLRQIEQTKDVIRQHQRVQQAQAQQYQQAAAQQWREHAKASDDAYDKFAAGRPEAEVKAVKENVTRIMREAYGIDEATLAHMYQTNATMRSGPVQQMMHDLVVSHLNREGIEAKRDRSPPLVQRPGSPLQRGSEEEYGMRALNDRIARTSGREQIRAAADLIAARRARR